ncbi:hypothetical protein [Photobacterium kishitanii]|uniref:hypothetical protein n=1 Tax=Photobacterium kishitanii TaxID=318456 RepID=UPI0027397E5F|nr:hypothetical protein [Photobacterium kishitanii]
MILKGNAATTYNDSIENISYRRYFQQAIENNKLTISNLIHSPISNSYVYIICKPFTNSANGGTIFASVSYAEIKKALSYQENTSIKNNLLNDYKGTQNNCKNINILKINKLYTSLDSSQISYNIKNKISFSYYAINNKYQIERLTLHLIKNTPWYLASTFNYNQYLKERFLFIIFNIFISIIASVTIGYYLMKKFLLSHHRLMTLLKKALLLYRFNHNQKVTISI